MPTMMELGKERSRVRKGAVRPEITPAEIRGLLADVATAGGVPFVDAAQQAQQGNYGRAAISGLLDAPPVKMAGMALAPLITAFHGSPYKFSKFDISKLGTGEGNQSYGQGMYFAESPKVASEYAKNVSAKIASNQSGNLYKVDIPDEAVARMINWDKSLGEQPKEIRAAIEKTKSMLPPSAIEDLGGNLSLLYGEYVTPSQFLNTWEALAGSRGAGERALMQQGISGIKYLDAGSRGYMPLVRTVRVDNKRKYEVNPGWNAPNQLKYFDSEEEAQKYANSFGTKNFVVFNPEIVKILERNNQPITGLLE